MKRLLFLLLLAACAADEPPERIALARAEAGAGGTILAPIFGMDDKGVPGVCGLVQRSDGNHRVVVVLINPVSVRVGDANVRLAVQRDIGETRFCSASAQQRWQRQLVADPTGLRARLTG